MSPTIFLLLGTAMTLAGTSAWGPMPGMRHPMYSAPMVMDFMRPRRAPPMPRPPPPAAPSGYPARTLTFSGYFSGAGAPQSGDPYAFSWGPALRGAQSEEVPAEALPAEVPVEGTPPPASEEADNAPPAVGVPADDSEAGVEARAQPGPGGKPNKPSYPAPAGPNPGHPGSPGNREPEDKDSGSDRGYGTINAWFPFMFSGGWPGGEAGGSPAAPRGYGAPNPPRAPAPTPASAPASTPSSNSQWPAAQQGDHHPANPSSPGSGGGRGGSPYYPVAIANSFSTGRNAMASSTATAYGGAPSRS